MRLEDGDRPAMGGCRPSECRRGVDATAGPALEDGVDPGLSRHSRAERSSSGRPVHRRARRVSREDDKSHRECSRVSQSYVADLRGVEAGLQEWASPEDEQALPTFEPFSVLRVPFPFTDRAVQRGSAHVLLA